MKMKGFWEIKKGKRRFLPACDYPHTKKEFIKANGIRFWVEREGKGPPLILIHGGPGGNHCYFHPNISLLAKRRTLVYYDLRGHYMSSAPKDKNDYGLRQDAEDVEALRQALKLGKIDLLGHSYGGIVALRYALTYPNSLKHIIFCSTPVDWTDEDRDKLLNSNPNYKKWLKKWEKAKSEEEKKALYYEWYFKRPINPESKKYNEMFRLSYKTRKSQKMLEVYEKNNTEPDWKNALLKINKPMLFIFGKYDLEISSEKANKIISLLNNAQLVIFEESGHDPFTDEPEKFYEVVERFLRGEFWGHRACPKTFFLTILFDVLKSPIISFYAKCNNT
jgi:proline iminopeptidase